MLPAAASAITQAISLAMVGERCFDGAARSLYGSTIVSDVVAAGHPGGARMCEGRDPAAGAGQQRVDMTVIVAGEFDDLRPPGRRRASRIALIVASVPLDDEPDFLDRRTADDLLGQLGLWFGRRPDTTFPGRSAGRRPR